MRCVVFSIEWVRVRVVFGFISPGLRHTEAEATSQNSMEVNLTSLTFKSKRVFIFVPDLISILLQSVAFSTVHHTAEGNIDDV